MKIFLLILILLSLQANAREYKFMSYNIKALPGIASGGKDFQFQYIGEELARLRENGEQPDIIFFQEAFKYKAIRLINENAGYKNTFTGPYRFGIKLLGSGLVILSDLELEFVMNIAFPTFLCADWDCFSAKGYQIVKIKGTNTYLVNTHLNASNSSMGSCINRKSIRSRLSQVKLIGKYIKNNLPADAKIIFAGDFNIKPKNRDEYSVMEEHLGLVNSSFDCLRTAGCELGEDDSEDELVTDTVDMILYTENAGIKLNRIEEIFESPIPGTETLPSDHDGYLIHFESDSIE